MAVSSSFTGFNTGAPSPCPPCLERIVALPPGINAPYGCHSSSLRYWMCHLNTSLLRFGESYHIADSSHRPGLLAPAITMHPDGFAPSFVRVPLNFRHVTPPFSICKWRSLYSTCTLAILHINLRSLKRFIPFPNALICWRRIWTVCRSGIYHGSVYGRIY